MVVAGGDIEISHFSFLNLALRMLLSIIVRTNFIDPNDATIHTPSIEGFWSVLNQTTDLWY